MYVDDTTRLRHMLDAARDADTFMHGRSREDLNRDRQLAYAVVHCLQIIGEAASKITVAGRERIPEIPWPRVVGMRHRIAHDYINVDLDVVWDTVRKDLPRLIEVLNQSVEPWRES